MRKSTEAFARIGWKYTGCSRACQRGQR